MTAKERAIARADRHQIAEAQLHHGLSNTYGYSRIYNAEVTSYEQGDTDRRKICIDKVVEWLKYRVIGSSYSNNPDKKMIVIEDFEYPDEFLDAIKQIMMED